MRVKKRRRRERTFIGDVSERKEFGDNHRKKSEETHLHGRRKEIEERSMPPKSTRVLRGSASKKQRQEILSLATGSSPPKGTRTKKLTEKQAKSSAMATMRTPFDAGLEHVLINYLSAAGSDHHIRKAFIHEDVLTFENFINMCTVDNIKTFQRDDGNNSLVQAFSNGKLTVITNA